MAHRFITHDEDGDLRVRTPYNDEFIEKLKSLVDRDSRRWVRDPAQIDGRKSSGYWAVNGAYEESLEKLVRDYWGTGSRRPREPLRAKRPAEDDLPTYHRSTIETNFARPEVVYSVDDYVAKVAEEDVHHVIKELTAKVSALTYELDQAQLEAKAAQQIADRYRRVHTIDERTIAELRFKLSMAELKIPPAPPTRNGGAADVAYETLHLAPDAPPEVVSAAWKALIVKHHPDKGGDPEKAKAINNARDTILGK